jgi:hypothetical protein
MPGGMRGLVVVIDRDIHFSWMENVLLSSGNETENRCTSFLNLHVAN